MRTSASSIERQALALAIALSIAGSTGRADDTAPTEPPRTTGARKGFSIDLAFVSDYIGAEDPGPDADPDELFVDERGGGLGLRIAYGFTPSVALGITLAAAAHGTTVEGREVAHASSALELRYTFLPHERARPFLEGGLGGATLALDTSDLDVEATGGMTLIGAGIVYDLTRHFRLTGGVRLELINWSEVTVTRTENGETETLTDPVEDRGAAGKIIFGVGWAF